MPEVLNKEKLLEQAKLFADQGKLDRAIQEYAKVLQMDPKDLRLKLRVAELYVKTKKMSDAIRTYQEVADSYCSDAFYLKAVTVYKNILRLNPSMLDVNRRLADLYEKMGLATDAVHQYQIVANMLEQKSMDVELLEVRRQIVSIAPDTSSHRVRLAEAYQLCGKEEEAINEYEILVKQLAQTGTPEQLIELYEKILAHRPDNMEMVRSLCVTYVKVGEWKKALKRMESSYNQVLQDPEMLTQMAEFYARQNQMATASEKYRDLADLYLTRQENDNAVKAYAASAVYAPEEEGHVRELVEQLDPGLVGEFVKAAEARREWLAKAEADAEAAIIAAEEAAKADVPLVTQKPAAAAPIREATVAPVTPPAPKVKVVDAKAQQRQIDASLQLAETYCQMGLKDEAMEELQKVMNEAADPVMQSRMDALKAQLSRSESPQPEAKPAAPRPSLPPRAVGARSPSAVDPKPSDKKKRISFV